MKTPSGEIAFAPNPDGPVCDALPVCLFKALDGRPVCLLFSVSCHPSTIGGFEISAEYPGVAMAQLDAHLGHTASLFLQGAGGDTKPRMVGQGRERWRSGNWDDVAAAGSMVAREVIGALEAGLAPAEPDLCARSVDMVWPLQPGKDQSGYEAVLADPNSDLTRRLWAEEKLAWLKMGQPLPVSVPITLHYITLGQGLRLVGLEGEPVAELGRLILRECGDGVTFPLGYTDGAQLYLPTSAMLDEGGYEVDSYYEYRQPAPLAKGMEDILTQALRAINTRTPGCHTG